MSRRLLVTGASGGLGFHAVQRALRDGWQVTALVRPATDLSLLHSIGIQETLPWKDLESEALVPFDAIVHLAAYVHQDFRQPNYEENHRRANHHFPVDLARKAVAARVSHFVFVSTIAVFGRFRTGLVDETTKPGPSEAYGASKRAAEEDLQALIRSSSTQLTILRLPMVYGPRVKGNMIPLLHMAARGRKLPLGSTRGKRSFLYAGNFADALSLLLKAPTSEGKSLRYFLADGADRTSGELYDALFRATNGVSAANRPGTYVLPLSLLRLGGILGTFAERFSGRAMPLTSATVHRLFEELRVDSRPFQRDFGWSPPYSPEEGLKRTVEWSQEVEG